MLKIETWLIHLRFINEIKACDEVIYSFGGFLLKAKRSSIGKLTRGNVTRFLFLFVRSTSWVLLLPWIAPNPPHTPLRASVTLLGESRRLFIICEARVSETLLPANMVSLQSFTSRRL